MSTKYQMFMKQGEKFRFPVLPEKVAVSYGASNNKLKICGVGEVTVIQDSDAATIQFSSFFPKTYFSGCNYRNIPRAIKAVKTVIEMKESGKPVRFTITGGIGTSMYCTIENFETYEQGGDPGTIFFSIKLKEYREIKIRQITVDIPAKRAKIEPSTARTDNSTAGQTYTVVRGDCLWNIAKKIYGSGAKNEVIYNANRGVIGGNPNFILAGQVLTIPAA